MPLPFLGAGGGLITLPDAISVNWSNAATSAPGDNADTSDLAISFKVGAVRHIGATLVGLGTLYYRINSGSYTAYTVPFAVTTGQTLGWRVTFANGTSGNSSNLTVRDTDRGENIDTIKFDNN